jgi:predicted ribosomally synthesized peptide with SipW-like signal peptide
MKRIIMSVGAIVFVGALYIGATGAFFSDTETSNGNTFTAGAIDLTVDSTQHYNNAICINNDGTSTWQLAPGQTAAVDQYPVIGSECNGSWTATNLGAGQQFFNFADVKPADQGEDTVSLHIDNNPAYACVYIKTTGNNENGVNDPESKAGDTTLDPNGGELAQNINVFAWLDNGATTSEASTTEAGDNIWEAGEPVLQSPVALSTLGATTTLALADASTGTGPLGTTTTSHIGLAWCAGTITINAPGSYTCDGSTMGNNTQTDSATSTVSFYVVQARNNADFLCSAPTKITQNDLFTGSRVDAKASGDWFFYNDTNDSIMTPDQFSTTGGQNHIGTTDGVDGALMTLDAGTDAGAYANHIGQPRYNIATYQFASTSLSSITALGYRVFDATNDSDVPFLNFNVDFNGSDSWQNRLVYVPGVSGNPVVPVGSWTVVDALQGGNAMWCWSGMSGCSGSASAWPTQTGTAFTNPNATYQKWSDILAAYPGIQTRGSDSWFGVRVGEPGPAAASATIDWIKFNNTTYDFGN